MGLSVFKHNWQVYSYNFFKRSLLLSHPGGIVIRQSRNEESGMLSVHVHRGKTVSLSHTKQPMEVGLLHRGKERIKPTVLSLCIHMYHSVEHRYTMYSIEVI